jgi:uncharacterized OB-fold protein
MASPTRDIRVKCPKCAHVYSSPSDAHFSMTWEENVIDDFTRQPKRATCPECGFEVSMQSLVADDKGVYHLME